jgi:Ni/Co efflux regulator RcnB
MYRKLLSAFLLSACLLSFSANAQDDKEKADLKKKIEMTIRRLDIRIDKVNADHNKTQNQQVQESANDYKKKMESQKAMLQEDLKKLPDVTQAGWKDFVDDANEHMDKAKESAKPVVL